MHVLISVIICTRNNADSLARTLQEFGRLKQWETNDFELIVVDNASADHTNQVVRECKRILPIHYIHESRIGLSHARNTGIESANGDALLFTDDDVVPTADWISRMAGPLLSGQCKSITGRISLASSSKKIWMKPMHELWLAAARTVTSSLVGACMGFHRSVLDMIPAFDTELGSGALGFAEETLFSMQLDVAGYSRQTLESVCVIHSTLASRLNRQEWIRSARRRGRSSAYIQYHWEHCDPKYPSLRACYHYSKLIIRKSLSFLSTSVEGGAPEWELTYITEIEKIRGYFVERRRPRNYPKRGLVKHVFTV